MTPKGLLCDPSGEGPTRPMMSQKRHHWSCEPNGIQTFQGHQWNRGTIKLNCVLGTEEILIISIKIRSKNLAIRKFALSQ